MRAEVRPPIMRLVAQRPFNRKIGQQTGETAMKSTNHVLSRHQHPKVLPFREISVRASHKYEVSEKSRERANADPICQCWF